MSTPRPALKCCPHLRREAPPCSRSSVGFEHTFERTEEVAEVIVLAPAPVAASADALAEMGTVTTATTTLTRLVRDAARRPDADRRRFLRNLDRAVDGLAAGRAAVLVADRHSGAWHGGRKR